MVFSYLLIWYNNLMHNIVLKNKAKSLRRNGYTVRDIAKKLGISFSTVSFWCRDIKLSRSVINKMKFVKKSRSIKGLLRYSEKRREQRIENVILQKNIGAKMVGNLSRRDIIMIGLGLYWGEGYKESNGEMGFTNSNPNMILFYLKWLFNTYQINKERLTFRLSLNNFFKKKERDIKNFWTKFLKVDDEQFTKTTFIKTKLKKAFDIENTIYKGILRVKVKKGLIFKNKTLGAIDHIANI